ncbi:aspartate racemase [miscellaneous Crenarchaeota group archaeon SMTZ-80]|nr:MAG: aspartate racemase [miscellaneous Crenarchaeota group archaeon SMTZ-80]
MKTIGLIGGMSWESTVEYYRIINEQVKRRLGGLQSARIVMVSLNFHEVEQLQRQGKWDEATDLMIDAAKRVEKAGSDLILICTNTMHKMADQVEANIGVPLLHIVDTTAEAIKSEGLKKVGLFGTKFTMEQDFYKERLTRGHGIVVIVPESMDREVINEIIYEELCMGKIRKCSREKLKTIIRKIVEKGAEGIVLGCTELPLLLRKEDTSVSLFDTCKLHAEKAVEIALQTE